MRLAHVDITYGAVAVVARAHGLLAGTTAGVEAKGVGAGGIAKAILLCRIGDAAGGITAQGIARAVGLVLALAFTIPAVGEIIAAAGGKIALPGAEGLAKVEILMAPVV